jgi:hypothetical protein
MTTPPPWKMSSRLGKDDRWGPDYLHYPFSRPARIHSLYEDPHGRSLPLLLASLAHYGEMCLQNKNMISPHLDSIQVAALTSLCAGTTLPDHFNILFADAISEQNGIRSTCILPASVLPNSDSEELLHPELSKRKNAKYFLFYQHLNDNNWVILLTYLDIDVPKVDGYFIGHVVLSDLDPIVNRLTNLFWTRSIRRIKPSWTRRVHVPGRFSTDNTFTTYALLMVIQQHCAYLDLTMDIMSSFKFRLSKMSKLLQAHDRWLGELKIEDLSSIPFITDDFQKDDNLQDLYRLGWTVQDVLGDGNCGFYALLLGLLNIGIREFNVNKDNWQRILFKFRNSLRVHSYHMLTSIYPRRPWEDETSIAWIVAQASDEIETKRLSESLAPTRLRKPDHYLTAKFKEHTEYHMNPGWAPHVLASKYRIRVIVYMMVVHGKEHSWTIQTFEYVNERHVSSGTPHVKVDQQYDIPDFEALKAARISDEEFKRIPTIEILFQTGLEEGSTQHFQYLQRSVCSSIREPTPFSQSTLKEFLRNEENVQHYAEPTKKTPENNEDLMDLLLEDLLDLDPKTDKDLLDGTGLFDTFQKSPPCIAKGTKRSIKPPLVNTKKPAIRVAAAMNDIPPAGGALRQEAPPSHVNALAESLPGRPFPSPVRVSTNHTNSSRETAPIRVSTHGGSAGGNVHQPPSRREVPPSHVSAPAQLPVEGGPPVPVPVPIIRNPVDAPIELVTDVVSTYRQEVRNFSLCYPMANALVYAGYPIQAYEIYKEADRVASSGSEQQIGKLTQAMQAIIPVIASPTIFILRITTNNRKKRRLTWDLLFNERSQYPTIIILGEHEYAFCVVDDLIFDSITSRALRLCMESVRWLCGGQEPSIKSAYRYGTKYSSPGTPKKHRTKGVYKHTPRENWNHD